MAEVVVVDLEHVTVDGEAVGCILDVPENRPDVEGIKSLTLAALRRWSDNCDQCNENQIQVIKTQHESEIAELTARHAAAIAALQKHADDAVAAAQAELSAALESRHLECTGKLRAELASKEAAVVELRAQIDALGGTELGQRLAREAKIQAAQEAVARAQADLACLATTPEVVTING